MGLREPQSSAKAPAPLYVNLHYEVEGAAERCWDEAEFRRQVASSVGYDPFRAGAPFDVDVHVDGSRGLVAGRVEWHSVDGARLGERRFRAKDGDCTRLLMEMSFAVGLQIELLRPKPSAEGTVAAAPAGTSSSTASSSTTASASAPPRAKAPAPPVPTPPQGAGKSAVATSDRVARTNDWRAWVGLGPSLAFGSSPSVTGHARFFLGARYRDLSLELGAEGTLPVTEREPDGAGFRQRLLGGSAMACGHRGFALGCVMGKLSQLRIAGLDVDQPESPTALVAQAGLRVGVQWEPSRVLFVTPHLDALLLLTPRRVTLNLSEVWEMPPLSALVGIDLGARFR